MKQKLAYIHIPKTGGTYLGQLETRDVPVISPVKYLGHMAVVEKEDQPNYLYYPRDPDNSYRTITRNNLEQYFVFSTVRNIFSWLVSYAGHAGAWPNKYLNPDHYDYDIAQKGFEYLVKAIAERETPWPNRKFIFFQLFTNGGALQVNWLTHTETLDDDLISLADYAGVSYQKNQRQRLGQHKDYRTYYTDSLVEHVYKVWGRELTLYGYNFECLNRESAILSGHIDETLRNNIKYIYETDTLFYDQKSIEKINDLLSLKMDFETAHHNRQ